MPRKTCVLNYYRKQRSNKAEDKKFKEEKKGLKRKD